ncbi:MAG: DUF87 domain-containing protein [Bacilli bacterium]|nr:DUF87 domain-containing protein [Bacilli bacterium]
MSRNIYYKILEANSAIANKVAGEVRTKYKNKETGELTKSIEDVRREYPYYDIEDVDLGYNMAKEETEKEQEQKQKETPSKDELTQEQIDTGNKIVEILASYGIKAEFITAKKGPNVTQYSFSLAGGTRINDVKRLDKEIAMGLAVKSVSVEQVEGTSYIGIQVPNEQINNVSLDEVLNNTKKEGLSFGLGVNLKGEPVSADILKLQHILIGGSTGSGKSSCINSIICSLIKEYSPEQVKLVLIDPKRVELAPYSNISHLLMPIITDSQKASETLKNLISEMDKRYSTFEKVGVKNIESYNNLVTKAKESGKNIKLMPYIVVVIDELADLMQTTGKEVESSIQRLTQLARASGIHLIVATQRPSVDVVTGVIKSNLVSRIAFTTSSGVDSKTIIDKQGAEKLLGKGDMLYRPVGSSNASRLQGVYVPDDEVEDIVREVKNKYPTQNSGTEETVQKTDIKDNIDNYIDSAVQLANKYGKVSPAILQIGLHIPYSKAVAIINKMIEKGIIKNKEE